MLRPGVLSVRGYGYYDYQGPSESQQVRTVPSDDVDDSKIIEYVHVLPKTASIIEDISVGSGTLIIDEAHVSFDSTSDDVNEIVESNILAVPSRSFKFFCAEYEFMIVPTGLSTSESSEFLIMIQQMIFDFFSFTGCLEFVLCLGSVYLHLQALLGNSDILFFSSLGIMFRVHTALRLHVAHIDDITRPIAICNNTYKFDAYPYSILQEFAVDNKVMVTSHPKAVRKWHAWRTDFNRILKKCFHCL